MKRIISLLLIAVLCAVLLVSPAAASTDGPSKAEIQEKWRTVTAAETIFETDPSIVSPYAPGTLTTDFLESGITYLNFVRYVAGLPEVTLDDTLNTDAQYGAVCLAAIDTLTHYPTQPDDMDDAFFNRAYDATTSANISARWGYAPLESLQSAVSGCMADNGSLTNLSTVGHRRWLLNPTLGKVGFGYAKSSSGWSYIVNHVHDRTGAGCDYDFISWPVSGNHPTNLFDVKNPWSITLNTKKYQTPSADEVKITITRESDGSQWTFDSATGQPSTHESPYMIVNTQWYGIPNCIIFHPGSGNVDAYEGIFTVDVTGIYTASGAATSLHYQVDFFDLDACLHDYEAAVTAPTCTEEGYTTFTCTLCGDSYTGNRTDALGHSYGAWHQTKAPGCESAGTEQRDCTRCGISETRAVSATGHSYSSAVTEPTCTEQGYTTHTCTVCGDSYVDSYTDALGHSYASIVTAPTCTEDGVVTYTCSRCGDSYTELLPAPGHNWDGYSCTSCGMTRRTLFDDVVPGSFYEKPVAWAVEEGITKGTTPTTFNPLGQCQRAQAVTFLWRAMGSPDPKTTVNPFVDVKAGSFYYKAVLWAVENKITHGLDATHFGPNVFCNRAQVVTFLWRTAGRPAANTENPFTDVAPGQFCYDAVLWAAANNITKGLTPTEFGVNTICNRAQIVTFLYRTLTR